MTVARKHAWWISPEEYLAGEEVAQTKHEYVGGVVYGMSGATNRHNTISGNIFLALGIQLRGKRCRPFNSDTKVRIRYSDHERFYYPDAMVACESNAPEEVFQEQPVVVFEVLSPSAARVDRDERVAAYKTSPSVEACVLVESVRADVTVYRREPDGRTMECLQNPTETVELPAIGCVIPLREIYADTPL